MIDDIRYLIVFAKVAETGSLSRASEALALSVATISMHLAKLEKNLGTTLLYRNTRKLSLTFDGANLLETARTMLELYEKGVVEFARRSIASSKSLRISIPALFIKNQDFMTQIGNFIKHHPDVNLDIICSDIRNNIIDESIDVAFRIGDLPDSTLKAKRLFDFSRQVVASPVLLDQYPALTHPRDLAKIPWLGLTMRPNLRTFTHANGETCDVKYVPQIRMDNVEAVYQLARQGVGLAAPPLLLAHLDIANGSMVAVLPEWSLTPMRVYAVWPPNIASNSMAYVLINGIYDALNTPPCSFMPSPGQQ